MIGVDRLAQSPGFKADVIRGENRSGEKLALHADADVVSSRSAIEAATAGRSAVVLLELEPAGSSCGERLVAERRNGNAGAGLGQTPQGIGASQTNRGVDGEFAVWRSKDAGESWQKLTNGLPEKARLDVLREAKATDTFEDAGIYVGTNTGQLFYSCDSGDNWQLLADFLPPIQSVEVAVVTE